MTMPEKDRSASGAEDASKEPAANPNRQMYSVDSPSADKAVREESKKDQMDPSSFPGGKDTSRPGS